MKSVNLWIVRRGIFKRRAFKLRRYVEKLVLIFGGHPVPNREEK
jgi:hypothetical protein